MSVSYALRVDEKLKEEVSAVAEYYGLDLATMTRALWSQIARTKRIPLEFSDEEPNEESLEAIRQTREMIQNGTGKAYATAEELFEALGI